MNLGDYAAGFALVAIAMQWWILYRYRKSRPRLPPAGIRLMMLELSEEDYSAIQRAITLHQREQLPGFTGSNAAGQRLARICENWVGWFHPME